MVGTSCTNPLVTQGKKYVFRVCFIDPFQGAGAADYALKELKAKSAAMLIEVTEDYSVGLGNFFKQNFTKNGGKIVSVMNYQKGDQDFTAQLTEIISKNPDVLYIPANFAEGAIIMRQARELGAKFSILGGDAMDNPEMVKIGGDSVEGFLQLYDFRLLAQHGREAHEPHSETVHGTVAQSLPRQRPRGPNRMRL